jgi:hypothetical protein
MCERLLGERSENLDVVLRRLGQDLLQFGRTGGTEAGSRSRFGQSEGELLEAARCGFQQHASRRRTVVSEPMGNLPRSEVERARTRRDSPLFLSDDEQDFTLEDVAGLVLVVMEMPGNASSRSLVQSTAM